MCFFFPRWFPNLFMAIWGYWENKPAELKRINGHESTRKPHRKKETVHMTLRLANFYLNPFTIIGYSNNFFFTTQILIFWTLCNIRLMVIFRTWVTCRCRLIYPCHGHKITSNIFFKKIFHETFKLTLCWLKLLWFLSLLTLDHYKQVCTTPKMTKVHLQLSTVSRVQMFRLHELAHRCQQARQRRQGS